MRVLQFDSEMIADPSGIQGSAEVVLQAQEPQPIVVVPSMGSSTETLLKAGQRSAHQDVVLASTLAEGSRTYHMQVAEQITPTVWQETKRSLSNLFEEITDLLKGLYLLGELSPRSEKVLQFYSEGLAATILAQALKEKGCASQCLFHRELFGAASRSTSADCTWHPLRFTARSRLTPGREDGTGNPPLSGKYEPGSRVACVIGDQDPETFYCIPQPDLKLHSELAPPGRSIMRNVKKPEARARGWRAAQWGDEGA